MAGRALTRKSKAITLVPLAVASAAWTASIMTVGGATAAKAHDGSLPGGAAVPNKAIQAPASVPIPGRIAPAVPNGSTDQVVASASTSGIPSVAIAAYQRAAQIMDSADTSCNVPWELVAAIGRVESNHGTYGGNVLTDSGFSKPGIYGPVLDGSQGTAAIHDTDGGELDHNTKWDRAVGPMQFIPSTWSAVKVDADGDGKRDPQDINDASLATAVYLCSGSENLATRSGQQAAVYRYNHSNAYVDLVLRIMEAYSNGDYSAVPSGSYGGGLFTPDYAAAIDRQEHKNRHLAKHQSSGGSTTGTAPGTSTGTGSGSTSTGTGTGTGSGTGSTPTPTPTSGSNPVDQTIKTVTTTVQDVTSSLVPSSGSTSGTSGSTSTTNLVDGLLGPLDPTLAKVKCAVKYPPLTQKAKYDECVASYS